MNSCTFRGIKTLLTLSILLSVNATVTQADPGQTPWAQALLQKFQNGADWFVFGGRQATDEAADTSYYLRTFGLPLDSEIQILRVSSNAQSGGGFSDLKLSLDDDALFKTLIYYADDHSRKEFNETQLRAGVVMLKRSGKDILKLKGEKFDHNAGGTLVLDYLNNGITGARGAFKMDLLRTGKNWALSVNDQAGRREFTTMFLAAKTQWPVGVVGIDHVEVK